MNQAGTLGPRQSGLGGPLMFVQFLGNISRNLWNTLGIDLDSVQPYGTIPISDNQHPKGKQNEPRILRI